MQKNVGNIDRALRLLAGIVLLAILIWGLHPWRWVGLLGFAYLATGLFRWCPAYALFGMNTCEANKPE